MRRSNNQAFCCSGTQTQGQCFSSLVPSALADELIQVASLTLALTASTCESLRMQSSGSGCFSMELESQSANVLFKFGVSVDEVLK